MLQYMIFCIKENKKSPLLEDSFVTYKYINHIEGTSFGAFTVIVPFICG